MVDQQDEVIETEQEIFIDKMPKPKRQGIMEAVPMLRFAKGGEVEEGIMSKIVDSMGDDFDYFTRINIRKNLKQGEDAEDAADLAEEEAMKRVREKYGFAKGGEVEDIYESVKERIPMPEQHGS